jgi:curved DNA-binding protein CbpA
MSSPAPTAKGNLRATPLVNLVVYALDRQLTGTLVLEQPDHQKHAVYFEAGAPAKVRLAKPTARLGEVLVDLGHLAEAEREKSFAHARANNRLHGESLRKDGVITDRILKDALREQLIRKALVLATIPEDTIFGYFDGLNFLEQWGGEPVRGKPLALVWRLVQVHADPARVRQAISSFGDQVLRLHPDAPIRRFQFGRREQSVIDVLRAKPQPFAELRARELTEPELVERMVYALAITRQFDRKVPGAEPIGADEAPSSSRIQIAPSFTPPAGFAIPITHVDSLPPQSPSAPRSPLPPPSEGPEVRAFKAEIRERAARHDETLYDVLGVARDAPVTAIQSAYLALAKKWHPDRLGPEYQDVNELATRVFARISEAHQVLSDTALRRDYNLKLRKAGAEANEQEHVQRVLRAATSFQKAEVLLKRSNLAEAELHAKQALTDDPDQADHVALVAWLASQKPEPDYKTVIRDLDRAISMQPNNVRAHWYRGQIYKRLGKDARAIQDFRFIVEREPRNVEANRELRLYNMRRGGSGASGVSSIPPGNPSTRPSPLPPNSEKTNKNEKGEGGGGGSLISKLFKR